MASSIASFDSLDDVGESDDQTCSIESDEEFDEDLLHLDDDEDDQSIDENDSNSIDSSAQIIDQPSIRLIEPINQSSVDELTDLSKSSLISLLNSKQEDLRLAAAIGEALFDKNAALESHVQQMEARLAAIESNNHSIKPASPPRVPSSPDHLTLSPPAIDPSNHYSPNKHRMRVSTASIHSIASTMPLDTASPYDLNDSDDSAMHEHHDQIIESISESTRLKEELSRAKSALLRSIHRQSMSDSFHADAIRALKKQNKSLIRRASTNERQCKSIIVQMTQQIGEQQSVIQEQTDRLNELSTQQSMQIKKEDRARRVLLDREKETQINQLIEQLDQSTAERVAIVTELRLERRMRGELERSVQSLTAKCQELQAIVDRDRHRSNSSQQMQQNFTQTPPEWLLVQSQRCQSCIRISQSLDSDYSQQPLSFSTVVSPLHSATFSMESHESMNSLPDISLANAYPPSYSTEFARTHRHSVIHHNRRSPTYIEAIDPASTQPALVHSASEPVEGSAQVSAPSPHVSSVLLSSLEDDRVLFVVFNQLSKLRAATNPFSTPTPIILQHIIRTSMNMNSIRLLIRVAASAVDRDQLERGNARLASSAAAAAVVDESDNSKSFSEAIVALSSVIVSELIREPAHFAAPSSLLATPPPSSSVSPPTAGCKHPFSSLHSTRSPIFQQFLTRLNRRHLHARQRRRSAPSARLCFVRRSQLSSST